MVEASTTTAQAAKAATDASTTVTFENQPGAATQTGAEPPVQTQIGAADAPTCTVETCQTPTLPIPLSDTTGLLDAS